MGIRFRKSIKLAPGIRMNFSGSGVSWTVGGRGASVNIGKRGTYLNAGIPGSGIYARERIGGGTNKKASSSQASVSISVSVADDGTLCFRDANGNPISEHFINIAKKQQGDAIKNIIQKKCDEINSQINSIGEIYIDTQNPNIKPQYQPQNFLEPLPVKPIPKKIGFIDRLFKSRKEKIENENKYKEKIYSEDLEKLGRA